jgi:tetratricopeptide (TPR) repeat protein
MEATVEAVVLRPASELAAPLRLPPVPWRDPHSVAPEELAEYIGMLERKCIENPDNADLRTCLGMALAMNFDVYRSMDALEEARRIEPDNFWAQMKYSELYYRLRALERAEEETRKAVDLAGSAWELSLARRQLSEIRRLKREGTQKPAWTKPLAAPALMVALMVLICGILIAWK